jgi:hypothetical protein
MDGEVRIAVHHLVVAVAWPFAILNAAKLFHWVDHHHQYYAASFGIAASMALAAGPVILVGVCERLRRRGVPVEVSFCASTVVLCGIYLAAWLYSQDLGDT